MTEEKKKRFNTNSNTYTIIYSVIIVIIVAFLLAFVFRALKPAQDENVALDKKKQILYALNIRDISDKEAASKYKEVIIADRILDVNGNIIDAGEKGGEKAGFLLNSSDFKAGKLALYICEIRGERKYVIPVYGMGLWGAISGYVAINDDKRTVYGVYFNHDGETAGLGAEIKDDASWQAKFIGKELFSDKDTTKIALSVSKKIEDPKTQVDIITGATLTSNGVTEMFHKCLGKYMKFLNNNK